MIPEPKSERLRLLLKDRPSEWVAVRVSFGAGLREKEIAKELGLPIALVREYLGEGWREALLERHEKARQVGGMSPHPSKSTVRTAGNP